MNVQQIPLRLIDPDPNQPRKQIARASLVELSESIAQNGVVQPIAVEGPHANGRYTIIYGERRWRAAQMSNVLETVPAVVHEPGSQSAVERFMTQILENQGQEPLDPIDEAHAMQHVLSMTAENGRPISRSALALRWGRSLPYVDARLRLPELPDEVQDMVRAGQWPTDLRVTRALLSVPDTAVQVAIAKRLPAGASISVIINTCQTAVRKMAQSSVQSSPTAVTPAKSPASFEATQILAERGEDPAPAQAMPTPWTRVRLAFGAVCDDCSWKLTAGVAEPAWAVVMEAFGATCATCANKMSDSLDTCRDCPAPDALSRIIQGAKR